MITFRRRYKLITAGIIAEFNPLHNGHKYLMDTVKDRHADAVIAVMSGSFVQRGAPALTDKWTRTEMALKAGADLVLELPVVYSMNTAQKFARGAVEILNACGLVDILAFGSESRDIERLQKAAELTAFEPREVSEMIKKYSSEGMSFPTARKRAFLEITGFSVPDSPNDILASEYMRAIYETGSSIRPVAVKRIGTGHDSRQISGSIASASEIRRRLASGESAEAFMPHGEFPVYDPSRLDAAVIGRIRECGPEYISRINDVGEGLENRFIRAAQNCCTVEELCSAVKSKRYTLSRIRRITWSVLLGLTKEICSDSPKYIRVLGMNETGRQLLKKMKKTAELPVVVKAADYDGAVEDKVFSVNSRAEDWFSLCAPEKVLRRGGRDLTVSPVLLGI